VVRIERPDPDGLLIEIADLVEQIQELRAAHPDPIQSTLLDQYQAIAKEVAAADIQFPHAEQILNILRSQSDVEARYRATRRRDKLTPEEDAAPIIFNDVFSKLDPETQQWMAGLVVAMIRSRDLEAVVRTRLRGYLWNHVQHDNRQYILLGQNDRGIMPRSWVNACWGFVNRFRCNLGWYVTEAMLYQSITIIGVPDLPIAVTSAEEQFLREYLPYTGLDVKVYTPEEQIIRLPYQIERIWVRTTGELQTYLQKRIDQNMRFEGGNVGPDAPNLRTLLS
jgi:hypothetical protein